MFSNPETTFPIIRKPGLYPVKSAEQLLRQTKRQLLVAKIKQNCGVGADHYENLYEPVVNHFVEFVQALPFYPRGKLGGLMDYGLVRAGLALQLAKEGASLSDPLTIYAIFTVALLRDVGKVLSQQHIMISDAQGQFLAEWSPFDASLLERGDFYKVRYSDERWLMLGQAATPLLAQQLLPTLGFSLLAQNNELLQKWLSILLGNSLLEGDPLENLLQLLDERLEEEIRKAQLPDLDIEIHYPEEMELAEEFVQWLSEELDKDRLSVNQPDSWIHALESGGLFLDKQLFNLFCQRYGRRADWLTVLRQLNRTGMTQVSKNQEQNKLQQFYANPTESAVKTRMSYFLTGAKRSNTPAGLSKVREGIVFKLPEVLAINLKKLPPSALNLQAVQAADKTMSKEATADQKLSAYIEQIEGRKNLQGKLVLD